MQVVLGAWSGLTLPGSDELSALVLPIPLVCCDGEGGFSKFQIVVISASFF